MYSNQFLHIEMTHTSDLPAKTSRDDGKDSFTVRAFWICGPLRSSWCYLCFWKNETLYGSGFGPWNPYPDFTEPSRPSAVLAKVSF